MKRPKPIEGAGGVVFNARREVLLIQYPDKRGGGWSFPKGHIDPGETLEVAAVREVLEEGGVRAEVTTGIGNTEYINPSGVLRTIHWFVMHTDDLEATPEPGFQARFFDYDDALELLTHRENRALLMRAAAHMKVPT